MKKQDIKLNVKKRARIAAGMVNLLRDDIDYLRADADDFDVLCLEESIKDAKATLQMLSDHVTEIEYMLYLFNSKDVC
jgi:hypothetical protein